MTGERDRDALKRAAARRAAAEVADGMVVGLGSGSTAELAVEALAERVAGGLRMTGVPTSSRTEALARRLGVPLTDLEHHPRLDLDIDGADQVEKATFNLVKGLGGALLREKIVASTSTRMIVVVDDGKLVERLGGATPLPVEIVSFGWPATLERLADAGFPARLRQAGGRPFVTDGGNYIADCAFSEASIGPSHVEAALKALVGVVETGLFIGLASMVVVGRPAGVEVMRR